MLRNVTQLEGFVIHATDGELGTVYQLYFDDETWAIRYLTVELGWLGGRRVLISPISVIHVDWQRQAIRCRADERTGGEQPEHRYGQAHLPAARDRVQRVLRISLLLGWSLHVGPSRTYPGGVNELLPRSMRTRFGSDRRIRICAVPKPSLAITLRRPMVKSAMLADLSWTMKPGLSATSRWQRRIGGRAKRCWFHPPGLNG